MTLSDDDVSDDDVNDDRKSNKIRRKFDLETTGGLPDYQTQSLATSFQKRGRFCEIDAASHYDDRPQSDEKSSGCFIQNLTSDET